MTRRFPLHTPETAPPGSRALLERAQARHAAIPNLYRVLADAPAALEAYMALSEIVGRASFSPAEQQVIAIAVSVENGCSYCVASHTAWAARIGVAAEVLAAVRDRTPICVPRLEALRRFAESVVRTRGRVAESDVDSFLAAGFGRPQTLEVVLIIALKALSNYASHIADPPLNAGARQFGWNAAAVDA